MVKRIYWFYNPNMNNLKVISLHPSSIMTNDYEGINWQKRLYFMSLVAYKVSHWNHGEVYHSYHSYDYVQQKNILAPVLTLGQERKSTIFHQITETLTNCIWDKLNFWFTRKFNSFSKVNSSFKVAKGECVKWLKCTMKQLRFTKWANVKKPLKKTPALKCSRGVHEYFTWIGLCMWTPKDTSILG